MGAELRRLRRARGLTQAALAARLGISFQQVQRYECGAAGIGASRLFDCAQALDVAPERFFAGLAGAGNSDGEAGEKAGEIVPARHVIAWAAEFDALPDDALAALLILARTINRRGCR